MLLIGRWFVLLLTVVASQKLLAQNITYPDPALHYLYPAGGQQGQQVQVRMGPLSTLKEATQVIIDGPGGITASDFKRTGDELSAIFTIAPDAPPGRRLVRVLGGSNGLTNFRYFFVGRLPEVLEKEPNETPSVSHDVTTPAVINGRIGGNLDIDCFRFQARAGERIVAAVLAHGMDSVVSPQSNRGSAGFLDAKIELLDEQGRTLAEAEDTLGLDPVLEFTPQTDGKYVVRVQSLGLSGADSAVYRLTLGNVPYPAYVFPGGGRRGEQVKVELGGPNVPQDSRATVTVSSDCSLPMQYIEAASFEFAGPDLPFLRGDFPEIMEAGPNNLANEAVSLELPVTANGRFEQAGDQDWYRLHLKKGDGILFEVTAQRHLRSSVDTLLEVYDAAGKKLAENDDGRLFARPNHCAHDFSSADSWLAFTATQEGDYFVRLSEQTGAGGPHAIYRLTASVLKPDFQLYQWPDAVPIWGPGTTASFLVEIYHWGGLKSDLTLEVAGLPPGWRGSSVNISATAYAQYQPPNGTKALLTITAPADALPGDLATFRVIGRAEQDGRTVEHEAQPMTLYCNSHNDGMLLRASPQARAVVTKPMDCWLETPITSLSGKPGETITIPIKVHRQPDAKSEIGLVVNGPTVSAGCGLAPPMPLKPGQDEILLPLKINEQSTLGTRGIVVARSWASDVRQGRPGPCTPLILLNVRRGD